MRQSDKDLNVRVDVYHHGDPSIESSIEKRLDTLISMAMASAAREKSMASQVENIKAALAAQGTVIGSVETLVQELKDAAAGGASEAEQMEILEGVLGNNARLDAIRAGTALA